MHIPDGFLDGKTAAATAAFSAVGVGYALRQMRMQPALRLVPLMGLAAAFVFAAQMLNFPIAGGTSGHMTGAVLISVLVGPGAAVIVMTSVLIVQCFLFADGGVTALGANIFNMGIAGTLCGYGIYRALHTLLPGERGRLVAAAFAAWCATVLGAVLVAGELAWSESVPWTLGFPTMTNVHILVGLVEAAATTLVLAAIWKTRSDLLRERHHPPAPGHTSAFFVYGSIITLGLILFVSPFASPWPDPLEKIGSLIGFRPEALLRPAVHAPMVDYRFPGFGSATQGTAVAGVLGALTVFCLATILARLLVRNPDPAGLPSSPGTETGAP